MLTRIFSAAAISLLLALATLPFGVAEAADDGIVRAKSSYGMTETVDRLKQDIAAKGIKFSMRSTRRSLPPMPACNCGPRPC